MKRLYPYLLFSISGIAYVLWLWHSTTQCFELQKSPPRVELAQKVEGPLSAAASAVELPIPFPVVVAGYGPVRSTAFGSKAPLFARALVLRTQNVQFAWVVLDTLLVPHRLVQAIREKATALGFTEVWVSATHTHSSFGEYAPGFLEQLAGTGFFRKETESMLVTSAIGAIERASLKMRPVEVTVSNAGLSKVRARTGEKADNRLTRLQFVDDAGTPAAQILVLSAHPTLVEPRTTFLSPDYPGQLAHEEESAGHGVTLVVQGAAGNASVSDASIDEFANHVSAATGPTQILKTTTLSLARVQVTPPAPDASRLVPDFLLPLGNRLLCQYSSRTFEVSALRLGDFRFWAVPGEPVHPVGLSLEYGAELSRVVGLTNGYIGYIEEPVAVEQEAGESKRQYFDKTLKARILEAQMAIQKAGVL